MYQQRNERREVIYLLFYTLISNLALINTGATLGYSSVVLPILTNNTSSITLNTMEVPLFGSIIAITRIIGCFLCPISMIYGRRWNMIICGVFFFLGWSLIASSYNVIQLFVGRALTGIAMGLCAYSTEIYLEEISMASWREVVTIIPNIADTVGILVVYFLGFVIQNNWRLIAAFFIILSIFHVLCIFLISESPVWLLLKGRKEAARIALLRIRGLRQETIEFQEEFAKMVNYNELRKNLEKSRNCQSDSSSIKGTEEGLFLVKSVCKLKRITLLPEVWKPFVILCLYFLFQQFSGLYVIITYTVDVITRINITTDPFLITVILGIIQVVGNVITACCSRRIGRRAISIVSGAGISISLGALMVYLQFFENTGVEAVPLTCIIFYMGFGSFGFFTIPWSMIAELYPSKYINVLGQLTTLVASLCSYTAVQLYPMMVTQNRNATFYFYCITAIIATIFLTIALPETRGKTKTEIEETFRDKLKIEETSKEIEESMNE